MNATREQRFESNVLNEQTEMRTEGEEKEQRKRGLKCKEEEECRRRELDRWQRLCLAEGAKREEAIQRVCLCVMGGITKPGPHMCNSSLIPSSHLQVFLKAPSVFSL